MTIPVRLVLEDGSEWHGLAPQGPVEAIGEVVFNTSMAGYQEVLTDPSYAGQIVVMTYPLIGNYGVHSGHDQSLRPQVAGFITRELCTLPHHAGSAETLPAYLHRLGVPAVHDFDTRALTRHLRRHGTLRGVLTSDLTTPADELAARARSWNEELPALAVTTDRPYTVGEGSVHVVVIDYGVKRDIVTALVEAGCRVTVVPATTPADEVLALEPDGVVLSNGPGDPRALEFLLPDIRRIAEAVPTFGICLGHQLLGLAFGAKAYKLPYGHRGSNHPVKDLRTGQVAITSQNHGYAIDRASAEAAGLEVTHINLNDGSVEGLVHPKLPVFSVQFHPEAAPGPGDARGLFAEFLRRVRQEVVERA